MSGVEVLTEAIDPQRLNKIIELVEQVNAVLGKNKELLPDVSAALKRLTVAIRSHLAQKGDIKQWAAGLIDQDNLGVAIKQLELFYNTFRQLQEKWGTLSKLFEQDELGVNDFQQMRSLLNQAISGGFMNKVMAFFKTKPYPGLEPKQIIEDIVKSIETIHANAEGPETAKAALAALNGIMDNKLPNLSAFSKQETQPTQATDATQQATGAQGTQQTEPTGKMTGEQQAQTRKAATEMGNVQNASDLDDDEKQIAAQLKNPDNMARSLNVFKKAGYNVVPA